MAMLASKSSMSGMASSSGASQLQAAREYASAPGSRRTPLSDTSNHGTFASPTESEFSEPLDGAESVRTWDEKQVCDWLKSMGCGACTGIFKENNVNGSNLIECDQAVLKEMGIKKVGDRVRIFMGIKALRNKAIPNQKKRNRESIATLDRFSMPSSLVSNATYNRTRELSNGGSKRFSMQFNTPATATFSPGHNYSSPKAEGRPGQSSYFPTPTMGRRPETPSDPAAKINNIQGKRPEPGVFRMPGGKEGIRFIHGTQTKVLDITGWKSVEDVMNSTLRKLARHDANSRNFCFYVHDPTPEAPENCRRLSEKDLGEILSNPVNPHRGRLILRTIHSGEPSMMEIDKARDLAMDEIKEEHRAAYRQNSEGSVGKLEQLLGERRDNFQAPLSPVVVTGMKHTPLVNDQRRMVLPATKMAKPAQNKPVAAELDAWTPPRRVDSKKQPSMRKFQGTRPPSELISHDLSSYFTDHEAKELQRTVSMAQRRNERMSKAASRVARLSTASTFSVKDVLKDAPVLPSIPANFLEHDPFANTGGAARSARPLSVWRQSVASVLPSVREDASSSNEPNRKSYVSIHSNGDDSGSRSGTMLNSYDDTSSVGTYLDEGTTSSTGTDGHNTLNEQYREALKADGEGSDEELDAFLTGNTFDKASWMQGDLIGQGSFGSVYLALHAVTGELMAVKQVELPGRAGADAALEKRKESMLAALKREINLLSELQHEHIVQYLGVQATDEHLNIFLEYVPGGSVASMLNNYGMLHEPLIRNLVRQILDGLNYLHKRDIIHRDIKGANILVDNKGKVKISDFGISKKVDLQTAGTGASGAGPGPGNKRVSMQGSVFWMAPEVVKQTSYTRKADIWSMGALIVEMFTGEHPFPKLSQIQAIFQLGTMKKPEIPSSSSQDAKDFLEKTFEIDEKARPEAQELMRLPFLKPLVA